MADIIDRQLDTVVDNLESILVDQASSLVNVEKTTGDSRRQDYPLVGDLLFKTAAAAAFAEAVPFFVIHFCTFDKIRLSVNYLSGLRKLCESEEITILFPVSKVRMEGQLFFHLRATLLIIHMKGAA